tara:strand:- start:395 stop:499 length:105 start_codon:yes stop_codon:yes gene_type:complete
MLQHYGAMIPNAVYFALLQYRKDLCGKEAGLYEQ